MSCTLKEEYSFMLGQTTKKRKVTVQLNNEMLRSFCSIPSPLNPNPQRRVINKFDTPPTAGLFTKVSSKPTNHSKFTGRCGKPKCSDCHMQPASKSKDKAKGSHKLKSATDVSIDFSRTE
ncbi:hypothetical protein ACET3Z_023576 [Daucus carota]